MTYYYLYKITNKVNGKIYVGVHKTTNMNDGYMGSGKIISQAISKYGLDNFEKEVLETFDTAEAMYAREKEVVTSDFLLREDVYNVRRGGNGGFDWINTNIDLVIRNKKTNANRNYNDGVYRNNQSKAQSQSNKKRGVKPSFGGKHADWTGRRHTTETKKKQSVIRKEYHKHHKNPSTGTRWITDERINRKIQKYDPIPFGWRLGRVKNWI